MAVDLPVAIPPVSISVFIEGGQMVNGRLPGDAKSGRQVESCHPLRYGLLHAIYREGNSGESEAGMALSGEAAVAGRALLPRTG